MQFYLFLLSTMVFASCSIPDLSEPTVFADASKNGIELKSLKRKFMFGMFFLFVDQDDEPFSGWVKSTTPDNRLAELGYLLDGRKEGLWIEWDKNGSKESEIYWKEDRMDGKFSFWHPNGQVMTTGQTSDGEVDGEWTEYYSTGQIAAQSTNRIGHLVEIKVWKPDGTTCEESKVTGGNGSFYRYLEDGRFEVKRTFADGMEISRKVFNQ